MVGYKKNNDLNGDLNDDQKQELAQYEWTAVNLMQVFQESDDHCSDFEFWGMLMEMEYQVMRAGGDDGPFVPDPNRYAGILFNIMIKSFDSIPRKRVPMCVRYWVGYVRTQFGKQFICEYVDQLLASMMIFAENTNNDNIRYIVEQIEDMVVRMPDMP